jgi:hypothetical protein
MNITYNVKFQVIKKGGNEIKDPKEFLRNILNDKIDGVSIKKISIKAFGEIDECYVFDLQVELSVSVIAALKYKGKGSELLKDLLIKLKNQGFELGEYEAKQAV